MRIRKITAAAISAVMLFTYSAAYAANSSALRYSGEYNAFEQVAEYIAERYIDASLSKEEIMAKGISKLLENNDEKLVEFMKAMLESLDDYSEFYTAEEFEAFESSITPTFFGIGISMKQTSDGYVEVTGFADGSDNAKDAGFMIGDRIIKVNGEDVVGKSLNEVRSKVVGEKDTSVDITVLRDDEEIEISVKRVEIRQESVYWAVLENGVGYIQIASFGVGTSEDFTKSLDAMREHDVKKIILDLRNNGGGIVSESVEIAQQIVPRGKIVDVKFRESKYNVTYNSTLDKKEFDFAVLVNENTASAAEILASAIQDSKCGTLIGTTTYGKAVIQNTYPLTNGMAFKLTTGEYITRSGKKINHIGIYPDEYIENETSKADMSKYTPFNINERASLGSSGDNVKAAKERLSLLKLYNGDVQNDVFDAELKTAISNFQKLSGILSYGVLDIPTQRMLDEAASQVDVVKDYQLDKALNTLGVNAE